MKTLKMLCKYSLILVGLNVMIISCAPKLAISKVKNAEPVFFPKESDTARLQFLTSYSKSSDIVPKQSAFKVSITGEEEVFDIAKPYGVAMANGKMYICDLGTRNIVVLDLENHKFNTYLPKVKRGFAQAINIFTDTEGLVYLVDPLKRLISIYDANMNYITEFGSDVNYRPLDVAVTDDKIYVVDISNNRVNIFDKTSKELIGFFPDSVVGNDDWLYSPTSISVADNQIYITDTGDFSIKTYSLTGDFIKKIGKLGDRIGQFSRPKGNAVDKEGNVYVLDAAFQNAQIFNKEGQLLMFFGGAYNGPGDMYLPAEIIVDYKNKDYFKHLVDNNYDLLYLIIVTNQFGPEKVSVYGRVELKK